MISKGLSKDQTHRLLDEAASRNTAVELQFDDGGETRVAKTRLIGIDNEHLYLDAPEVDLSRVHLRRGLVCDASLCVDTNRYTFDAEIIRSSARIELNDQKTVRGVVVRRPATIVPGQRRSHYRVSLLNDDPITATLYIVEEDEHDAVVACPMDAPRFRARLVNLSAGGLSIVARTADVGKVQIGSHLFAEFNLPGDDERYELLTDVRQRRDLADGTALRLGLRLKAWPDAREMSRVQQRLQRYLTELQRSRLKRAG